MRESQTWSPTFSGTWSPTFSGTWFFFAIVMSASNVLVWLVPFEVDKSPVFVWLNPERIVGRYEEHLCLSESLVVFYNINEKSPNVHLQKFGGLLSNIPGYAMFNACDPNTGDDVNVSLTLPNELAEILKRDSTQRPSILF